MTVPRALVLVLVVAGIVFAAVMLTRGGEETATPTSTTTPPETATPSAVTSSTLAVSAPATSGAGVGCEPIEGTELRGQGSVVGYPPGQTVDGRVILGSAVEVRVRTDTPGNRDFIIFRLVYLEGSDLHAWTDVDIYDVATEYDAASGAVTGSFEMRHSINESGPDDAPDPETSPIRLVFDRGAGSLTGTVTHPDGSFEVDMEAEETGAEFFDDVSCYPTPTEPVIPTP